MLMRRHGAFGEDIANFLRVLADRKFSRYRRNQAIDFLRRCQEDVLRKYSTTGQKGTATDVAWTLTSTFTSGSASGIMPSDRGPCCHRSFCSQRNAGPFIQLSELRRASADNPLERSSPGFRSPRTCLH